MEYAGILKAIPEEFTAFASIPVLKGNAADICENRIREALFLRKNGKFAHKTVKNPEIPVAAGAVDAFAAVFCIRYAARRSRNRYRRKSSGCGVVLCTFAQESDGRTARKNKKIYCLIWKKLKLKK